MYYLKIGEDYRVVLNEFNENISSLRKRDKIEFNFSIYSHDYNQNKTDLESLRPFYQDITVSKVEYYHWVFNNCQILEKVIEVDKDWYDYTGRNIEKVDVKILVSYGEVFSSHNKTLLDREIKIRKLLK